MTWSQLHIVIRALVCVLSLVSFWWSALLLAFAAGMFRGTTRRTVKHFRVGLTATTFAVVLLFLNLLQLQLVIGTQRMLSGETEVYAALRWLSGLHWSLPILLLIGILALNGGMNLLLHSWWKRQPDRDTIREGMEHMSQGICICTKSGIVRLANPSMQQLCQILTTGRLQNGVRFWERVSQLEIPEDTGCRRLYGGSTPCLQLSDGRVFIFKRKELLHRQIGAWQITATDVTRSYQKSLELMEKQVALKRMNRRLKEYGDAVTELTIEKEILASTRRVHSELEHALGLLRNMLGGNERAAEHQELLNRISQNAALLAMERPEAVSSNDYLLMRKTAQQLGVTLEISGELPERPDQMKLLAVAMQECLTNTIRHAGGDVLRMHVEQVEREDQPERAKRFWCVRLTNNGTPPAGAIAEGSGLGYLRRMAEGMSCSMQVEAQPEFRLTLLLPYDSAHMPDT